MRSGTKVALLTVGGLVAAILLVGAGFLLGINPSVGGNVHGVFGSSPTTVVDYALQNEVLQKLEESYYKTVDPASLEPGAVDGMLAGLNDPYTVYMDPEEYASFLQDASGSYSGVGMTVEMKDSLVTIVATFKGSPADLAGIKPGDMIVGVDDSSVDGETLDEVVGKIKGTEGTSVKLGIYRPPVSYTTTTTTPEETQEQAQENQTGKADTSLVPPGGETTSYTLTRKTIPIPVSDSKIVQAGAKKVADINFYNFSDGSAKELRARVQQAVEFDHVDAIVLDLRSNGGGLLNEAVDVASIFIPAGQTIVSTSGIHSPEQVYRASGTAYNDVPLYVLTDGFTASASEIVSGALQDYKRATLVGATTFGKGLVQSITELSNQGGLKVTTAVYLTPNGRDINKKGITPDVVAPDDAATANVDECLQKALSLISGSSTSTTTVT